ncbi:MAG: response regulator, partial [Sphingobacteriaceae bacterium]
MPDMDGMETTRRIRHELKLSLPVIALTASALPEDRAICISAGMNEYITKPFVPEDLLQKLSVLLQ